MSSQLKWDIKKYLVSLIIVGILSIAITVLREGANIDTHAKCHQDYSMSIDTAYNEGWFEGVDNTLKTIQIYMEQNKVIEDEYLLILDIVDKIHQEREYWIDHSSEDSQSYYSK